MPRKNKKGASAKAVSKKAPVSSNEVSNALINFRTFVDAVETGGLRYGLSGDSPEECVKRLSKLAEKVKPIAKRIRKLLEEGSTTANREAATATTKATADGSADVGDPCPEGFFPCAGVCLPWPCPDGGNN
ncbi:MAG: hypothetical protein ABI882_12555 [Acidobacteriota bacterium]